MFGYCLSVLMVAVGCVCFVDCFACYFVGFDVYLLLVYLILLFLSCLLAIVLMFNIVVVYISLCLFCLFYLLYLLFVCFIVGLLISFCLALLLLFV